MKVLKNKFPFKIKCPSCGSKLLIDDPKDITTSINKNYDCRFIECPCCDCLIEFKSLKFKSHETYKIKC